MKQQRGVTIVEAAIVLPVFFLLLLAIFEFGLLFSAYHTMVGAVREGARIAVAPDPNANYVLPTAGAVADVVCQKLRPGVFGAISTCSNYPGGTPNNTAPCPPFAGGTPPTLTTEDVYWNKCSLPVPEGGTETYIQVAVHRTVQLFWGWNFPISARAVMRSEAN